MAKKTYTPLPPPPPWGFLRETQEKANKAGYDPVTGLPRTGLEIYLKAIYPNVSDWEHDKTVPRASHNGKKYMGRPDYRSDSLNLIVEFDGLPHYRNPDIITKDALQTQIYKNAGYKVVRIPYFIQLTKAAVKVLFGVNPSTQLFPSGIASLSASVRNTPAYLCIAGIDRMKNEFERFPNQRAINIAALKAEPMHLTLWNLI